MTKNIQKILAALCLALLLAETPRHYERGKLSEQLMPEQLSVGVPIQMLADQKIHDRIA